MPPVQPLPLGSLLALGLSLPAQEQPQVAPTDLPRLRAAFAALPAAIPTIAIAVTRVGEPVILTVGVDAGGLELSPKSLLPLQALAKLLAADAIHAACRGKIDRGSGEKLGGRELTLRELLAGTALLPDYFVLDGSDRAVDVAVLRACGDLAVTASLQLRATTCGAAEFVLLEPLAFAGHHRDWPSMVRSTLAPRVVGLDPTSADALNETQRARLVLGAADLPNLAAARPPLLRTVLSVKDLATWWQWRVQQNAPLWTSPRMGRLVPVLSRSEELRWVFITTGMNFTMIACHYPAQQAGLVWCRAAGDPRAWTNDDKPIRAFEADMLAVNAAPDGREQRVLPPTVQNELATASPGSVTRVDLLAGSRWRSPPEADGTSLFQLAFGTEARDTGLLTAAGEVTPIRAVKRVGEGFTATGRSAGGVERSLSFLPQRDAELETRLAVVIVTVRKGAIAPSIGSSVPQFVELVQERK